MTLRHMKIFVAVYQQKSITLASNSLHLAQPSVSLAIRELEEYYHIRLFDRLSRRIYPTENGHRFYEYALHIVSLFSEMENKIPAWDANAPLHIGSSITLGTCLLPSLVKAYQEQHPEIKIYVTVKNTGTIEQAVIDNQLDFALVEGTVTHPEIISEVFSADTLCMVAAPGHPLAANRTVTLADAASCPSFYANLAVPAGKSSKVSFYPAVSRSRPSGKASAPSLSSAPPKTVSASQFYRSFSSGMH